MSRQKKLSGKRITNGDGSKYKEVKHFKDDDLAFALFDVEDLLNMAFAEFILLDITAKSLCNGETLSGDKIVLGVEKKNVTPGVLSTIRTERPDLDIQDNGFQYFFKGIRIIVKFIRNRYDFFKYPDKRFYRTEEYNVPNPFDEYWYNRFYVK